MPGLPEGVIVGQALFGAGVRFPFGHRDHLSLDKIDQAYVLHDLSSVAGEWPRTLDCRSGTARIDSGRNRGHTRGTSRDDEGLTRGDYVDSRCFDKRWRRNSRERCTRARTALGPTPSTSAISASDMPSTSCSTSVVRWSAGSTSSASV